MESESEGEWGFESESENQKENQNTILRRESKGELERESKWQKPEDSFQ